MEFADIEALEKRINDLIMNYLPDVDPTGFYTNEQQDKMRALRLLSHAEFEHFLETLCSTLRADLEREVNALQGTCARTRCIKIWGIKAIQESLEACRNNNGIKEKNLRNMFSPLGFSDYEFDLVSSSFLSELNQFGKRRGEVAHTSALRATRGLVPQVEKKNVLSVLNHIKTFFNLASRKRLSGFL